VRGRSLARAALALARAALGCTLGWALAFAAPAPAVAQMESREGIVLQNQILELRRDLQAVQQQRGASAPYYGGNVAPPSEGGSGLAAQLLDRVQTLEDQVRRMRGQLDEQTNAMRTAQDRLAKQIDDLNFRLGNATTGAPSASQSPPSASQPNRPPAPDSPPVPARRTPEVALQEGNAALARRDYPAAETAAREVIAMGRSPRVGDANFLLAQSLIGQRNFQGAAVAYDDAYSRSRTGSRAPDALLGLANALTGLNERPAACATLDKLRREFPTVRGPVRDTAAALRQRDNCS